MTQAQKQELLGGLIAGQVIEKVVEAALDKAAAKTSTNMTKADVPIAKAEVVEAVRDEVVARTEHVTNTEPFYQSRVTLGSIVTILGSIAALLNMVVVGEFDQALFSTSVAGVLGAGFALYGRWFAQKPLGR